MKTITLAPNDNVAVAIEAGDTIPAGHKVALRDIASGEPVVKYGWPIGVAAAGIKAGEWVHTHNVRYQEFTAGPTVAPTIREQDVKPTTFEGYLRSDGRVGTRNYIAVVAGSNCSADVVARIAAAFDYAFAITHGLGCGMAEGGEGHAVLQRCLHGVASNPNVAAAMYVSLGCEVNQIRKSELPIAGPPVIGIQTSGGVAKAIEKGIEVGGKLVEKARAMQRTAQPISKLVVGTNCGGSDGYSGITANPALGVAGDLVVAAGGAWVLGETPEIVGAQHLLVGRASPEVAAELLAKVAWWKEYVRANGASIADNPSPGNKAGGITTIAEKSLGAIAKGGSSPLIAVCDYAVPIPGPGLVFMDTPGHDPVSVTGMAAGGCNLIAFTTGTGSCLGFKPVPVFKISSTSDLFGRMPAEIDYDAGCVLSGKGLAEAGREILDALIDVASGRQTKSETQSLGDHTFVPWTLGAVL